MSPTTTAAAHTHLPLNPTSDTPLNREKDNLMIKLLLTLHLWGLALLTQIRDHARDHVDRAACTLAVARRESQLGGRRARRHRDERGSVTIEQVIWAGAVIVIVGIVVAAITGYVKSKSGEIK